VQVIVDTTCGKVDGLERDGVLQFRGIPYARAERFRPAQAPRPWAGVLDATRFGPVAPQRQSPTDMLLGIDKQRASEDCLVLNVYTPGADEARRPVMVWIHGGGFTNGSGHLPYYNGNRLAQHGDVVVVTINYRLGVFGFLHVDHLLDGSGSAARDELRARFAGSANNGLRDQVTALRWVHDNIAGFGGDPGRVTVFGESAGGMSVASLMASPAAAGLLHGAIAQSGAGENVLTVAEAERVTAEVLERLELPVDASGVERLLDAPVDAVLEAQTQVEVAELTTRPGQEPRQRGQRFLKLPFEPMVDGELLPRRPLEAVRDGSGAGIPLVIGTTANEWNLFMLQEGGDLADEQLRRRAGSLVAGDPAEVDEMLALYREARPAAANRDLWSAILTDHVFRMPALRLAEAQLPHAPVSMYRFDYPSTAFGGLAGACHAIDVPFVFDMVDVPAIDMLLGGVDDGTRRLARRCATAWTTTAHTGRPAHDDLDWPVYDLERRATCILHRDPAVVSDPEGDIRAFWNA
jgi:para-nitrobenzyl esterase